MMNIAGGEGRGQNKTKEKYLSNLNPNIISYTFFKNSEILQICYLQNITFKLWIRIYNPEDNTLSHMQQICT